MFLRVLLLLVWRSKWDRSWILFLFCEFLPLELHYKFATLKLMFWFLVICCCRSFAQTCCSLQDAIPQVVSGHADSGKDDLVQLSFNAIEVVYSVRFSAASVDVISVSAGNFVTVVF